MVLTRRHFFLLSAAALLQPATAGKRDMTVRSARPLDLEMPLDGFLDYITPVDRFFVRSHVYTPRVDIAQWRLTIDGDAANTLTLTIDDLRRMPSMELVSVLECAGNGRRFYEPSMPGLQWGHGAVGNGRWRGVRLADVLKRAGLKSSPRAVLFNGADVPIGTMPDFQRSIPIEKALHPATLLAYDMNGETLPVEHGFPLRVIVPGWAGDSWIKWVTSITVLSREHDGFWMARAYRHPGRAVAPGTSVPPEQMQPVTSLRVKSVIYDPREPASLVAGKPITIRGAAWSGDAGPVTRVEVSVDEGRSWSSATMPGNQRTDFGWRLWSYRWTPRRDGDYSILVRARDAAGNTQPLDQEWNPSGYLWNVAPRLRVSVGSEPTGKGGVVGGVTDPAPPSSFKSSCLVCHGEDVIEQQRLTSAQWDAEINKMVGWGARVPEQDRRALLNYLADRFSPGRR